MKDNTKGIDNDNSAIDNNVNLLITLLYDDLLFGDIAKLVFLKFLLSLLSETGLSIKFIKNIYYGRFIKSYYIIYDKCLFY